MRPFLMPSGSSRKNNLTSGGIGRGGGVLLVVDNPRFDLSANAVRSGANQTNHVTMKSKSSRPATILTAVIATLVFAGTATADWKITRSGNYKLWRDYSVRSGDAIIITASNVTLDLNGFTIGTRAPGTGSGIVVDGASGVTVSGGRVSGFNVNVALTDSENVRIEKLQIVGEGLAPSGGPSEIGIRLINTAGSLIADNSITSVNLGLFVRGGLTTGNRITRNTVVGGPVAGSNLLGICYNPAGGTAGPAGPVGDSIYNNLIARYGFGIAVSDGSLSNLFVDNNITYFNGAIREPQNFVIQGGTNVDVDNVAVQIPATDLVP